MSQNTIAEVQNAVRGNLPAAGSNQMIRLDIPTADGDAMPRASLDQTNSSQSLPKNNARLQYLHKGDSQHEQSVYERLV